MTRRRASGLAWIAAVLVVVGAAGCGSAAPAPAPETAELSPPSAVPPPRVGPPPHVDYYPREFNLLYSRGAVEAQSPQAVEVIRAIAEYAQATTPSCVRIIGHADTVGSDAANMALSIDRARALAAVLRGEGLAGPIYFAGRGENDLARPTPEGVDEPLNRRATVVFPTPNGDCWLHGASDQSPYERYPD